MDENTPAASRILGENQKTPAASFQTPGGMFLSRDITHGSSYLPSIERPFNRKTNIELETGSTTDAVIRRQ
jgi:hypothetical protein